jgi:hypothetical protein
MSESSINPRRLFELSVDVNQSVMGSSSITKDKIKEYRYVYLKKCINKGGVLTPPYVEVEKPILLKSTRM